MNKFRKILTSTALAAVMAVSISVGAVAEEIESDITAAGSDISIESESSIYADTDDYFVLKADDGTVSTLPKDADGNVTVELNGEETVLSGTEFLELRRAVGSREYLYSSTVETKDGLIDNNLTIFSGIYTITYNPIGNVFQTYYGVSAKIVGIDPNQTKITTEITINADYYQNSKTINYSEKDVKGELNIEVLDNNFTAIHAMVYTKDSRFGTSKQELNAGWSISS